MKRTYWITVLAVVVLLILWLMYQPKVETPQPKERPSVSQTVTISPAHLRDQEPSMLPTREEYSIVKVEAVAQTDHDKALYEAYHAPIDFWGKVVDENNNPIEGATVETSLTQNPETDGKKGTLSSDTNGLFSITGETGAALFVKVTKQGYYRTSSSAQTLQYAFRGKAGFNFPTRDNPTIFLLQKKGDGAALIWLNGREYRLQGYNQQFELDLSTGRKAATGIKGIVFAVSGDPTAKVNNFQFPWSAKITVPGGGLAVSDDNLSFHAPATGYVESVEIKEQPSTETHWTPSHSQRYFVHLPDDTYALINLQVHANTNPLIVIDGYYNPKPGDRYLEFDPAKEIKR